MPRNGGKTWRAIRDRVKRVVCRLDVIHTSMDGVVGEVRTILTDIDDISQRLDCTEPTDTPSSDVKRHRRDSTTDKPADAKRDKGNNHKHRCKQDRSIEYSERSYVSGIGNNDAISTHRLNFMRRNELYFRRKARSCSNKSLCTQTLSQLTGHPGSILSGVGMLCQRDATEPKFADVNYVNCVPGLDIDEDIQRGGVSSVCDSSSKLVDSSSVIIRQTTPLTLLPVVDNIQPTIPQSNDTCQKVTSERLSAIGLGQIEPEYSKNDLIRRYFESLPTFDELETLPYYEPQLSHSETRNYVSFYKDSFSFPSSEYISQSQEYTQDYVINSSSDKTLTRKNSDYCGLYEANFESQLEESENGEIPGEADSLVNSSICDAEKENSPKNKNKLAHIRVTNVIPSKTLCRKSDFKFNDATPICVKPTLRSSTLELQTRTKTSTNLHKPLDLAYTQPRKITNRLYNAVNTRHNHPTAHDANRKITDKSRDKITMSHTGLKSIYDLSSLKGSRTDSDEQRHETGYNTQDTTPVSGSDVLHLHIEEVGQILSEWRHSQAEERRRDWGAISPPRRDWGAISPLNYRRCALFEQICVTI